MLKERHPELELTGVEEDYDCAREAEHSTRAHIIVGKPEESTSVTSSTWPFFTVLWVCAGSLCWRWIARSRA